MTHAMPPILETNRLILRAPSAVDLDGYIAFYTSARSSMAGGPVDKRAAWNILASDYGHWAMRGFGRFAVVEKSSNRSVGLIGNYQPLGWPEKEIGWVLFTDAYENHGFAYEATRAVLDHTWSHLKWSTAVSYIDPNNHKSIKLAQRLCATLDRDAQIPKPNVPTLVYRHHRTGDAQ